MSVRALQQGLRSSDEVEVLRSLEGLLADDVILDEDASRVVLPACVAQLAHRDVRVRGGAVAAVARQLREQNQYLVYHVEELGRALAHPDLLDLKAGETPDTAAYVKLHANLIYCVCELQKLFPGKIMPHFNALAAYLVTATASKHLDIATPACEHWANLAIPAPVPPKYMELWTHAVHPRLGKLVPNLMSAMKYHEEHVSYLESKVQSSQYRPRTASAELEQYVGRRNFAAQGFENLAMLFGTEVVPAFKLHLIKRSKSDNWLELEASFLALGAFTAALGTPNEMQDVYSEVIPRLLESYNHPRALVRSITCFTMQHFVNTPKLKAVKSPFPRMMKSTLNLITDESLEVQEMALRSLATMLAYNNEPDMTSYSQKIQDTLVLADARVVGEARNAYYECIGHFLGQFGGALEQGAVSKLVAPLLDAFSRLAWGSGGGGGSAEDCIMLCQPLLVTIMFTKDKFTAHNAPVLDKAASFLGGLQNSPSVGGEPTTSQVVSVLDLLCAIFDNQSADSTQGYIQQYQFDSLMLSIVRNQTFEEMVHQSAMALLGHLYNTAPQRMGAHTDDVVRVAARLLKSKSDNVKNNTLWALGAVARGLEDKNQALFSMVNELAAFVLDLHGEQGVIVNAAAVLAALAARWPDVFIRVCARDDIFTHLFALMQTEFPQDNAHVEIFANLCDAFSGRVEAVKPELWVHFCVAAVSLPFDVPELSARIKKLLKEVRAHVGQGAWGKINSIMGKTMSGNLRKKYKLY